MTKLFITALVATLGLSANASDILTLNNGKKVASNFAKRTIANAEANPLMPPNPKVGECYARAIVPAQTRTISDTVVVKEASQKLSTVPAKYRWVSKQVVAKEASEKLIPIAATYKTVTERVMVTPESSKLVVVPAKFKNVTEKILVSPAKTVWKKGKGAISKVDANTGDILCLIEEPAVYKTVSKRVLVTPETTRTIAIPATYKNVSRQVVGTPATVRKVVIPAVTKTVKLQEIVEPAKTLAKTIPAVTRTVQKQEVVKPAFTTWKSILCETNTTGGVVSRLQAELNRKGYSAGPVDGVMGSQTRLAVDKYQRNNKLSRGGLTIEMLKHLNVM